LNDITSFDVPITISVNISTGELKIVQKNNFLQTSLSVYV